MKNLVLVLLLTAGHLNGYYDPTMRIHFGASSAILRLQGAYFFNSLPPGDSEKTAPGQYGTLSHLRLGAEAMFLLNNRGRFEESVTRVAPRFLLVKMNHDGPEGNTLGSISLAQALPCMTSIPVFGQVKGYWSIGVSAFSGPVATDPSRPLLPGGRIGFNCYNKKSALQTEVCVFENKAVCNAMAYRKLGNHLAMNAGVEFNRPVAGFSVLAGNFRFGISGRAIGRFFQHGVSVTGNF